ncbi:hypothetical protein BAJUN_03040 [Bajunvirus bajun]|uniref:Uncharacterized protein n=1 Tax=Brevundimonas phage vB_BgoS-Bajun TaxID=2948594 RepID=A0A9E7N6E1_9CAUD|nr:hypothetical protein BAJUN_03040 [Brevundimonas phage vB_BgoS-Bajun]
MTDIPSIRDQAAELFATGTDAAACAKVANLSESGFRQMIRLHYPQAAVARKAWKKATKETIRQRFFIAGDAQVDIAADYGVSRQRISQICAEA